MRSIQGCLPVVFSKEGGLQWTLSEGGALQQIDWDTGRVNFKTEFQFPHCLFMHVHHRHYFIDKPVKETIIELVGRDKNWILYKVESGKIEVIPYMKSLEGAEILTCERYQKGLAAIATYPNHSPAQLYFYSPDQKNADHLLELNFGYMWTGGLAVSDSLHKLACTFGDEDGQGKDIAIVDIESNQLLSILDGNGSFISACSFVDEYNLLISGDQNGDVKIWDATSGQLDQTLQPNLTYIHRIRWLDNFNALVVLGSIHGSKTSVGPLGYSESVPESWIYIWDIVKGGDPKIIRCGNWKEYQAADFFVSPDQSMLITGTYPKGGESNLVLWKTEELLS